MACHLSPSPSDPHELLLCGICAEPYDNNGHQAKFLTCHHTFCSHCLAQLSNRTQVNPAIIQCPNCRADTQLPENGVDGLQTNFYIVSVQEISKNTEPISRLVNRKVCDGHKMQPISYFCLTCGLFACSECTAEDHTAENGHSVISVSQSETCHLQELNVSLKSLNQNKRKLKLVESELTLLTAAKETALKEMDTFIKHAQEHMEQRRNVLKTQILDKFNDQKNALLDKQNQIQEVIELINKNNAQVKIMTKKTGDVNIIKPICESLKEANEKNQSIFSKMDLGDNYFAFDTDKGFEAFKECLCNLGDIQCKGSLPTTMRFQNLAAKVGHKSALTVEVYNHRGDQLPISSDSFSVQIFNQTDAEIHTELCTTGPDCTVTFTPQMSGLHRISGNFLGQKMICEQTHISVSSDKPVFKFGGHGNGNGTFNSPWSITIDNNDCLYVVDPHNKLIQKFSATGEFLSQFSVNSHDKDCTTLDMALDLNNGSIYCTDVVRKNDIYSAGNNMLKFNLDGKLQDMYQLNDMKYPLYLATNSQNDIFITDLTKKCLVKVDKKGNKLCHMGDFKYPGYVTVADDGCIIVPDRDSDCIYIFNPDGSVKHKFGCSGCERGQLKEPLGVAFDGNNILVTDSGNDRIQVFQLDGTFVSAIASLDDPLKDPRGLAVTKDGHVYVADCGNYCIKKYKYRDVTWWQRHWRYLNIFKMNQNWIYFKCR